MSRILARCLTAAELERGAAPGVARDGLGVPDRGSVQTGPAIAAMIEAQRGEQLR